MQNLAFDYLLEEFMCVCGRARDVFGPSFPFLVFFGVLVCMLDLWKIHSS